MKTITFHCETITPMFLAGADGKIPELRPPSIKGAMRFWWRAMNGHLSLAELKEKEGKVFGNGGTQATKSSLSIDVIPNQLRYSKEKLNGTSIKVKGHEVDILDYLAYGTNSYKTDLHKTTFDRGYILPNQHFEVIFRFQAGFDLNNIIKPMVLISRIGGLGSKTRNGFGKFHIEKILNDKNEPIEIPHVAKIIKNDNTPKAYLSLSKNIKVFQLNTTSQDAIKTQSTLGLIYKSTRSGLEEKHKYYKRSFLASPLQVNKKNESLMERHAKSYFLTISKSDKKFKGYIYYIPYVFLEGFDELMDFREYKKIMNKNHPDFLTEEKEQITEEWFKTKYDEFHNEFNILLAQKMRQL